MGQGIKSPQLRWPLLWFTPVEILGEIFCARVYNLPVRKLAMGGLFQPNGRGRGAEDNILVRGGKWFVEISQVHIHSQPNYFQVYRQQD
jgi:hypothetical protein